MQETNSWTTHWSPWPSINTARFIWKTATKDNIPDVNPKEKKLLQLNTSTVAVFRNWRNIDATDFSQRTLSLMLHVTAQKQVCYQEHDHAQIILGIECERHVYVTCHGSGPCDSISGTTTILTAYARVQESEPGQTFISLWQFPRFAVPLVGSHQKQARK